MSVDLQPGQRVAVAEASGSPTALFGALAESLHAAEGCEVVLGWVYDPGFVPEGLPGRIVSLMGGPLVGSAIASGKVGYVGRRYSQLGRLLAGPLRPDVVLAQVRPHRHGFALAGTASWTPAAAAVADRVVVEVNEGAAPIEGPVLDRAAVVVGAETSRPLLDAPATVPSEVEEAVAEQVLAILPLPCTLQYGPGGVSAAVVRRLAGHAVTLRSGFINEAAAGLLGTSHVGQATTTMVVSPAPFYAEAAAAGVALHPLEFTHDIGAMARIPRFVAINTALQVDLSGAVNVERVRGSVVGGVGGHPDFALAATLSDGGCSVVAFVSRRRGQPCIVPRLEVPATTGRVDVDVYVTEHGAAVVGGLDETQRAEALIGIAHPEDRDELRQRLG